MPLREGDLFDARYTIQRLLGRGGMGEVWAALTSDTGRRVAIKVLLEKAARKPEIVARFEREARIAARVRSPFVCELIDARTAEDGSLYLVFELMRGESLADRLKREVDLPFAEVTPVIADVLEGIVAAHGVGVIHRDLKPANIFLERGEHHAERAKVLDFGVSKLVERDPHDKSLTGIDATLGSFAYMAPEQVRGSRGVDERADVYAVGCVVFRALSGKLPFGGTTAATLLQEKLNQDAPSLTEATGEQWPAGIERFLARTLARLREDRFTTAEEAADAWNELSRAHRRVVGDHSGRRPPRPSHDSQPGVTMAAERPDEPTHATETDGPGVPIPPPSRRY